MIFFLSPHQHNTPPPPPPTQKKTQKKKQTEFVTSCKLSPLETICMKCQILFPGKNKKKYFKMLSAEIFTPSGKHQAILHLHKVSSGPSLSIHTFFSI